MSRKLMMNSSDIANWKYYSQEVVGSPITASDIVTDVNILDTNRFIEVKEIFGNTWQDENNLEDIQSLGDLYVDTEGNPILDNLGREQYKVEVMSANNLMPINSATLNDKGVNHYYNNGKITFQGVNTDYTSMDLSTGYSDWSFMLFKVDKKMLEFYKDKRIAKFKGKITFSMDWSSDIQAVDYSSKLSIRIIYDDVKTKDITYNKMTANKHQSILLDVEKHINGIYVGTWYSGIDFNNTIIQNMKLELDGVETPFSIPQQHKKTILLPCQLQKIRDIADRLYWDSVKNKYVVEKNIRKYNYNENDVNVSQISVGRILIDNVFKYNNPMPRSAIKSFFKKEYSHITNSIMDVGNSSLYIEFKQDVYNKLGYSRDIVGAKKMLGDIGFSYVLIKEILATPQLIETNITEKIKLPTYANKTHILCGGKNIDASNMKALVPYKEKIN